MYVELKHINKYYGDFLASKDVSLGIEEGSLTALLGPSGSGKTTILRMIAGLETPDSGDIFINGERVNDVAPSDRGIGFVFQNYALFRYMTVFDNIAFGLSLKKVPKAQIQKRVSELIELTGLKGLEKRYPNQLSGGQRQRVAFARALAPEPKVLLLDEPFAAIDAKVRGELRTWLRDMIHRVGITSIFVTHDQDEAIEVADKIIITNKGRVEQAGVPYAIYQHPLTPFTASFIGQATIIHNYQDFRNFRKIKDADSAIIRPEFVKMTKQNEVLEFKSSAEEGIVEHKLFRGTHIELKVRVNGDLLTTRRGLNEEDVEVGEKVFIFLYRLFVTVGDQVILLKNESLREEPVVI